MIEIYLNYDNMHTIRTINAFICINNHVNSCINSMLSGCPSHVEKYEIDKLESTTELCRFVGYPKDTFRYYFYCPKEKSIFIVKRAIFLEDEYLLRRDSGSDVVLEEVLDPNTMLLHHMRTQFLIKFTFTHKYRIHLKEYQDN